MANLYWYDVREDSEKTPKLIPPAVPFRVTFASRTIGHARNGRSRLRSRLRKPVDVTGPDTLRGQDAQRGPLQRGY